MPSYKTKVKVKGTVPTFSMQHLQMVHSQLKNLSLLELGTALFLAGCWDQPLELSQRGVDAVAALFLDDAATSLASHQLARVTAWGPGIGG